MIKHTWTWLSKLWLLSLVRKYLMSPQRQIYPLTRINCQVLEAYKTASTKTTKQKLCFQKMAYRTQTSQMPTSKPSKMILLSCLLLIRGLNRRMIQPSTSSWIQSLINLNRLTTGYKISCWIWLKNETTSHQSKTNPRCRKVFTLDQESMTLEAKCTRSRARSNTKMLKR